MPAVFFERGFKFHFYSNEGEPREPLHVHVAKRGLGDGKLWLYPEVAFAGRSDFDVRTERWIVGIVKTRKAEIESAWHDHFG